jgi:hypothetical protein
MSNQNSIINSLNEEMRCGMFTNKEGQLLIVHDKEIISPVQWAEFDTADNKLSLIHEDGSVQELGLEIDKKMQGNLLKGKELTLAKIENKKICSSMKAPIVIKDY